MSIEPQATDYVATNNIYIYNQSLGLIVQQSQFPLKDLTGFEHILQLMYLSLYYSRD